MRTNPSSRKLAALATFGAIILGLGIASAGVTNAFLYDGETLGTAEDLYLMTAAGNINMEQVEALRNTASSGPEGDCTGSTANSDCSGQLANFIVFGTLVMPSRSRWWNDGIHGECRS